ncbi:MAG: porin, partial [Gammaproteobacteria bacterium]
MLISKTAIKVASALVVSSTTLLSQSVFAEEPAKPSWNISGWINESMSYYDDGEGSDMVQLSDNGTTLGSRITFSGSTTLNGGLDAGFDVTIEPFSGNPNFTGNGNQITPLVFSNQDNLDSFNGGD